LYLKALEKWRIKRIWEIRIGATLLIDAYLQPQDRVLPYSPRTRTLFKIRHTSGLNKTLSPHKLILTKMVVPLRQGTIPKELKFLANTLLGHRKSALQSNFL